MNEMKLIEISDEIAKFGLKWRKRGGGRIRKQTFSKLQLPEDWPLSKKLDELINNVNSVGKYEKTGDHIKGVIASINELINNEFIPIQSKINKNANVKAGKLLPAIYNFCFTEKLKDDDEGLIKNQSDYEYTIALLRVGALYHDMGKYISNDHHVARGVHLMRDISEQDRRSIEERFDTFNEKRNFWSFLRHHDIFGCLCTGEASLVALFDLVSWSGPEKEMVELNKRSVAYLSYLSLLNIADSDSSLFFNPNTQLLGITTVEVCRYLEDWMDIKNYLWEEYVNKDKFIKREQFKNWSLDIASHPERTIRRITRLVASCYRAEISIDEVPEENISRIVEDELQSLHGARLEHFCYLFARFCKLDYGLRFFYILMRYTLLEPDHNLKNRKSGKHGERKIGNDDSFPKIDELESIVVSPEEWRKRREICLRKMVHRTCIVLGRIVEDYRHLVSGDQRISPLLCVIMSGLMTPKETGWSICKSLKEMPSRALGWISDEIGVRLYGE